MGTKQRGLLKGPKFSGRHTTLIAAAERLVAQLRDEPSVKKIVIGVITSRHGRTTAIKTTPIEAGLRIAVISPQNVQELFIYTDDIPAVQAMVARMPGGSVDGQRSS